ncbi:MAG: hypothetical protein ACYST6_09415 [Planctomycetota bacterium]
MYIGCKKSQDQSGEPGPAIAFPSSSRLLGYHMERGLDTYRCVKVEITREDLEIFLENSPFAGKTLRTKNQNPIQGVSPTGPSWWKVKAVKNWQSGRATLSGSETLRILLDLDKQDSVVIYLEWF